MAGRILLAILAGIGAAAAEARAQDYKPGEELTLRNCGRCHVVSEKNRMGGIGSTPSFAIIRSWDDWEARMEAFFAEPPHISFTQIEGVTPPFPINRPSPIHPIELTLEEIERIVDYARTVEPADLGDKVKIR